MDNKIGFRTQTNNQVATTPIATAEPVLQTDQEILHRIAVEKIQKLIIGYLAGEIYQGIFLEELHGIKKYFINP